MSGNIISIHAPREGGDGLGLKLGFQELISIHAPREGGDFIASGVSFTNIAFQSTPPARGATGGAVYPITFDAISIHAPREGGDRACNRRFTAWRNFNPRPPRGGRQHVQVVFYVLPDFNPRPPRGGRPDDPVVYILTGISIHAPREGGDRKPRSGGTRA